MSRLLDQPQHTTLYSEDRFHVQTSISEVSRYDSHVVSSYNLYHNILYSKNNYNSRHFSSGFRMYNSSVRDKSAKNLTPLPDWPSAMKTWGLSWEFHIYGFSVLYLMLTLISVVIFVRFRLRVQRLKIVYNTLILLATAGIFRAVFMLVDPYGYKNRMAGLMVGIMTQAVYPLFCACYGLTQVMLLRITSVDVGRNRLRTLSCLLGCTLTYLFVVVVIETLVYYQRSVKLLLLLDSGCFIVWSLSLGITFICSGFRLTQYATETKRAHKELNTFYSQRRSASNSTGLSVMSNITSDNVNAQHLDSASDALTLSKTASPTSDEYLADTTVLCASPTFISGVTFTTTNHRSHSQVRLSRPRLKISDKNHMTVTIATDDDDGSTSSTDVDRPGNEAGLRRVRRIKKMSKHKQTPITSRSRTKAQTSSSSYRAVTATEENYSLQPFLADLRKDASSSDNDDTADKMTVKGSFLAAAAVLKSENTISANQLLTLVPDTCICQIQQEIPHRTCSTSCELQLLASSLLPPEQVNAISKLGTSLGEEYGDKKNFRVQSHSTDDCKQSAKCFLDDCRSSPVDAMEINKILNVNYQRDLCESSLHHLEYPFSVTTATEPASSSPKENGYLADTENVFSFSAFSRLSSGLHQKAKSHDEDNPLSCDVLSQRSSSSRSDDYSIICPALPGRIRSNMSASLGLFRIRQSTMVQRAVHLTYFLTFLFMFACLLQLYTVFGVYGVLGTILKPDPWPWLIFHTIFRATEISIGLTIAAIAFITLDYRHQRAKRRSQQQQHLVATRDCIV